MIFPIADTPNPPGRPYATYLLIGINVAVYLFVTLPLSARSPDLSDPVLHEYLRTIGVYGSVTAAEVREHLSAYDVLVFQYGFRPAEFSLVALFSSLFLHGGLLHLGGNMLFLWIFGDNVEHRLGVVRYVFGYLFFGVAATLFFALFARNSQIPLVGASGAISGVLGCYYVWFPRNRVRCFVLLFPFLVTTLMVPARIVLGFYLLIDNLLPFLVQSSGGGGVAHGAHIGGFVAGLGAAVAHERLPWASLKKHFRREGKLSPPCAEKVGSLLAGGAFDEGAACYLGLRHRAQRLQVAPEDALAIGDGLLRRGDYSAALQVYKRFIAERQNDNLLDRAYLGAGYALMAQPRQATRAYQYFLSAVDLARSDARAEEARRQLRLLEGGHSRSDRT
ncbi:MAG: hypothetical protein C0618_09785 [Desulfuromonas sp.]|nr:MAG: hypothetical protein C0618_09785 [Desulfuromonas sp.]